MYNACMDIQSCSLLLYVQEKSLKTKTVTYSILVCLAVKQLLLVCIPVSTDATYGCSQFTVIVDFCQKIIHFSKGTRYYWNIHIFNSNMNFAN